MIMKNLFATILSGATLALAVSCGPKYQEPVEASQVGFAVSFLKSVNAVSGKGENVIVSPEAIISRVRYSTSSISMPLMYDAVMYDGHVAILRKMRMRIALHRQAMRSPTGMTDAGSSQKAGAALQFRFQRRELAGGLYYLQLSGLLEGHAGRIIAAIFKAMQAFDEQRNCRTMTAVADDPAHK